MAVDLDLAKRHLRVDDDVEDVLITAYLSAAKAWVENFTGKKLTRDEVTQPEEAFGSYVPLIWGPEPEGVSIAYTGSSGSGTIVDARLVGDRLFAPASGWPTIETSTPIVLTYTAGFEETPGDLDAAVLLLTGDFYANREAGSATPAVTAAVHALCSPYRAVLV